jgi:hypothetical protein
VFALPFSPYLAKDLAALVADLFRKGVRPVLRLHLQYNSHSCLTAVSYCVTPHACRSQPLAAQVIDPFHSMLHRITT